MNTKASKHAGIVNTEQSNQCKQTKKKQQKAIQAEAASKIQQLEWCQITISGHLRCVCVVYVWCMCVCMCGGGFQDFIFWFSVQLLRPNKSIFK